MTEDDKRITSWVDKITKLPIDYDFELDHIIQRTNIPNAEEDIFAIGAKLKELGYAKMQDPFHGIATPLFMEVKRSGGHYKYQEALLEKEKADKKYEIEIKNLHSSNQMNEWLYKYRKLPYVLSILAFIISLIALIYVIMDYYTD